MKMPAPTVPPMTSMVASNRPKRRASGCAGPDCVCGPGELKPFTIQQVSKTSQTEKRLKSHDGGATAHAWTRVGASGCRSSCNTASGTKTRSVHSRQDISLAQTDEIVQWTRVCNNDHAWR